MGEALRVGTYDLVVGVGGEEELIQHWSMQIAFRAAPGPATRASGLRQRTAQATEQRSYGPLAKQLSGASSGSQAGPTGRSSSSQHWQAGRSSGSWWESSEWDSWGGADWW